MSHDIAKIISLIDLTSLNDEDTNESILTLCKKAITPMGSVAAVCVYPRFVKLAADFFSGKMKIATVVNFPHGADPLDEVIALIHQSIQDGADEIDVVFPYANFLSGDETGAVDFIRTCKKACGHHLLKVILEIGALKESQIIFKISQAALSAGADFIKTSTGKIPTGATPEAALAMLLAIKSSHKNAGIKISGGIRTIEQALEYISLAETIMGNHWVTPNHFRIGASSLLDKLLI